MSRKENRNLFFDFPFWLEETVSDNIKLAKALSQIIKSAVAKFNYSKDLLIKVKSQNKKIR